MVEVREPPWPVPKHVACLLQPLFVVHWCFAKGTSWVGRPDEARSLATHLRPRDGCRGAETVRLLALVGYWSDRFKMKESASFVNYHILPSVLPMTKTEEKLSLEMCGVDSAGFSKVAGSAWAGGNEAPGPMHWWLNVGWRLFGKDSVFKEGIHPNWFVSILFHPFPNNHKGSPKRLFVSRPSNAESLCGAGEANVPGGTATRFLMDMATWQPLRFSHGWAETGKWRPVWQLEVLPILNFTSNCLLLSRGEDVVGFHRFEEDVVTVLWFIQFNSSYLSLDMFVELKERKLLTRLLARDKVCCLQ